MVMMKKRHLLKRYGLPAVILLFLLIWLNQQHAAEDTVFYNAIAPQNTGRYDPARRLAEDRHTWKQDKNPADLHVAYQRNFNHSFDHRITSPNATRSALSDILSSQDKILGESESEVSLQEKDFIEAARILVNRSSDGDLRLVDTEFQSSPNNVVVKGDNNDAEWTINEKPAQNQPILIIDMDMTNTSAFIKHQYGVEDFAGDSVADKAVRLDVHSPTVPKFYQTKPLKRQLNDSSIKWQTEQKAVTEIDTDNSRLRGPIFPAAKPTVITMPQKTNDKDDADDSLILARQMAAKNFVKSDVKHPPKDNFKSRLTDLLSINLDHHPLNNKAANSTEHVGRRQEMKELEWFAGVSKSPEYDLPLLNDKASGRARSSSTVRPELFEGGRSAVAFPDSKGTLGADSTAAAKSDVDEVFADTDDVMSSAVVLGEVDPNRMYAVFSTTTENREALSFIFLLPLTALAWKRVGFDSIIVIVGPVDQWNSDELLHFVLSAVRQLDAVVVFLEPRPEKSVMISQVSRLFIANILRARAAVANRNHPDVIDRTYVVTSDADIWPIYADMYRLPDRYDILSLNSDCCGFFSHRNVQHRMLPMANIGMRIGTWRKLTRRFGESPRSVDDILTAVVREFGPVALRPVRKGDNVGWFLDQMMVSLLVAGWTKRHGSGRVKLVRRDVGVDRVDRNSWDPGHGGGVADKVDAHLLGNAYLAGVWAQVVPLVTQLYGFETDRFVWCINYYDSFQKLFVSKYQSQGGMWEHH